MTVESLIREAVARETRMTTDCRCGLLVGWCLDGCARQPDLGWYAAELRAAYRA